MAEMALSHVGGLLISGPGDFVDFFFWRIGIVIRRESFRGGRIDSSRNVN